MAPLSKQQAQKIFYDYAYHCVGGDYDAQLSSKSLADLYKLAGMELKNPHQHSRKEHIDMLLEHVPQHLRKHIETIELLKEDLQEFSTDCDEDFFEKTYHHTAAVLNIFGKNNLPEAKIRNELYNLQYDICECLSPEDKRARFNIMKKRVANIKENTGEFDHDPLNIDAKRMQYFMKSIPIDERLKLLNEIIKKTKNSSYYNYTALKKSYEQEKSIHDAEEKIAKKEEKQDRFDEIMKIKIHQAKTNKEKIDLYTEAMQLVNYQDWGRVKKFKEKISICDKLVPLYTAEGMQKEALQISEKRKGYLIACDNSHTAAVKKGYTFGKKNNDYR